MSTCDMIGHCYNPDDLDPRECGRCHEMEKEMMEQAVSGGIEHAPDAVKLLQMIETVDPADTAKLDEIDARVWCWMKGHDPELLVYELNQDGEAISEDRKQEFWKEYPLKNVQNPFAVYSSYRYTRSRDALKAIRPEGWTIEIYNGVDGNHARIFDIKTLLDPSRGDDFSFESPLRLPTEELAELHAIIQAIAYERGLK